MKAQTSFVAGLSGLAACQDAMRPQPRLKA